MRTIIRLAALLALLLPALAACGSKKQIPFDPGQMHELNLPRQASAPPPPEPGAAQPSATGQPPPATQPKPGTLPPASLDLPATTNTAWPLLLTSDNVAFQVHEPTVDAWQDGVLTARLLVVAQPPGQQPVNGLVVIKAITQVDAAAGVVTLQDTEVKGTSFSAPPAKTQGWQEFLRFALPDKVKTVSLAHLESGQAVVKTRQQAAAAADITAPTIIFSEKPAVLVYVDGDPRYVPVKGTDLMGVLNTRVILLKDSSGTHYLRIYDGWVKSKSLEGPWDLASPPPGANKVEQAARASGHADLLPGKPDAQGRSPTLSTANLPQIVVSTEPTALIVLDGKPRFVAIPGTALQFASNTSAHLFKDESNALYVRIHGNWFRASAQTGPWQYVPLASLPAAFSAIPDDHPKSKIKASIAGAKTQATPDAWNVVAANPSTATLDYTMSGDPVLKPIRGTQLNYVANASVPIIQFDINSWYAVQNGVWFHAAEATGPWAVTTQIPPEIYAIPPTSPMYHAIHSRVISSSTDVVYYGYPTAGSLAPEGGATGVEDQGADYQYTPPSNLYWGWFY
jgi:hypothetical protein